MWWGASSCAVKSGTWCWCDVPAVVLFRLLDALCPIGDTLYPVSATCGCIQDVWSAVSCNRCNRPVVGGWSTLSSGVVSWGLVSDCLLYQPWIGIRCILWWGGCLMVDRYWVYRAYYNTIPFRHDSESRRLVLCITVNVWACIHYVNYSFLGNSPASEF